MGLFCVDGLWRFFKGRKQVFWAWAEGRSQEAAPPCETPVLGLRWEAYGYEAPKVGEALMCEALADALPLQREFAQDELDRLGPFLISGCVG